MQTFIVYAGACLVVFGSAWLLAYGNPASDLDRAALIEAAGQDTAAQELVRAVLARKRLQRRHVAVARLQVTHLVRENEAKAIVQRFLREHRQ